MVATRSLCKLENNPGLKDAYSESIEALLQKGHAEKVTSEDKEPKSALYLPRHAVLNPRKRKVIVVFDCAATHKGTSLNDQVLPGPDLTNTLLGILLRFREHRVAISADIEGMFLKVKVPEEDRDRLRFLWWPGATLRFSQKRIRMTSHLFGGTWSPSVSAYALRKTARDNSRDFDPGLVDVVLRDFYVDDCLKSVRQEAEAINIATELPKLLQRGGFRLHKWLSNSRRVLQAIPESKRAARVQQLNLHALQSAICQITGSSPQKCDHPSTWVSTSYTVSSTRRDAQTGAIDSDGQQYRKQHRLSIYKKRKEEISYLRGQQTGHHSLCLNAEPVETHSLGDEPSRWSLKRTLHARLD